ncbi:hypothetical protein SteCoe_25501 [Stentor coeruleus]|uniref:Uncharacterized protein n=1 Tax=Stentor coeruleus TaxID=5963 RepID=A0A1R2BF86_9CILI|nr:hypothetical protein SteCoe_25501 [Stentor coeruleus]
MKLRNSYSVKRASATRVNYEHYSQFCIDKFSLRLLIALKEYYGSIDSALVKLEFMLPFEVTTKSFISVLALLRISYTVSEIKNFIVTHSDEGKQSIKYSKLAQVIQQLEKKRCEALQEKSKKIITEGTSTDDLVSYQALNAEKEKLANISLRIPLTTSLSENFTNFIEAFKFATSSQTITYFGLLRLLNYLEITYSQSQIHDFMISYSKNGHITLNKFKNIWFGNDNLCIVTTCPCPCELLSKYCKVHLCKIKNKGKIIYKTILKGLDQKSQTLLKIHTKKLFYPSVKMIKYVMQGYSKIQYSKKDWKCVQEYLNSKDKQEKEENELSFSYFKKSPSVCGFNKLPRSLSTNKRNISEKHINTMPYIEENLFITRFAT